MFGKWDIFDVIKAFFRFLVVLVIGSVFAVLAWRMLTSIVPKELKQISPNDILSAAYEEKGDALLLYTQEQNSITRGEKNYGYFTSSNVLFIPEASQVQFLMRYNDSTLEATMADYSLPETLDVDSDWYDVTLVLAYDLTPDNKEDNIAEKADPESVKLVRVKPTMVSAREHKGLHSYRRFVFDGVEWSDDLLAVYADFYFVEDIRYEAEGFDVYTTEPYGALCLYAYTEPLESVKHKDVGLK